MLHHQFQKARNLGNFFLQFSSKFLRCRFSGSIFSTILLFTFLWTVLSSRLFSSACLLVSDFDLHDPTTCTMFYLDPRLPSFAMCFFLLFRCFSLVMTCMIESAWKHIHQCVCVDTPSNCFKRARTSSAASFRWRIADLAFSFSDRTRSFSFRSVWICCMSV